MTSCANAIKNWEEKNDAKASEAEVVKLYCQIPPIQKMDNSLNNLSNCTQLSLSTNSIDRIGSLGGLKNIKILSLGRNNIKKLEKLEENADSLEQLWISYNQISSLDGLQQLSKLQVLYMSNNQVKSFNELEKLRGLPELRDVLFIGNPMTEGLSKEEYRLEVLKRLPQVTKIDGEIVKPSEREAANTAP